MISLSRLIKSQFGTVAEADKKVISIRVMESGTPAGETQTVFSHTEAERAQILNRAEQEAESVLSNA